MKIKPMDANEKTKRVPVPAGRENAPETSAGGVNADVGKPAPLASCGGGTAADASGVASPPLAGRADFDAGEPVSQTSGGGTVPHVDVFSIPVPAGGADPGSGKSSPFNPAPPARAGMARLAAAGSALTEERLLALIQATEDVIYRMSPDWKIMDELYGKGFLADTAEPNETWLEKYIPPADQPFVAGVIAACIREKQTFELEHRVIRADGSMGWTYSRAIPLLGDDGSIKEWFGAARDITARRQAAEALRENEEKYRSLFDSIDQGFCIIEVLFDAQGQPFDHRFLEVNQAFVRQTGYIGAKGCTGRELVPSHEQEWLQIHAQVVLTGKPTRFQKNSILLGRYYDVYVFPIGAPEQRRVAVLFSDITKRKKEERMLQESEEKYRTIFETAGVGIVYGKPDGPCLHVNKQFAEMIGYAQDHIAGKMCEEFCFPGERHIVKQMRNVLCGGRIFAREFRFRHKDGGEVWTSCSAVPVFNDAGEHIANFSFYTDITARKKVEDELRRSKGRYRQLLKYAPAGICEVDYRNNRFLTVNDVMCEISGYSREEILGMQPQDFFDEGGRELYQERRGQWLSSCGPVSQTDYKVRTKDGRELFVSINTRFLKDRDKEQQWVLAIIHDVTGRREMELALRQSEQALRQSEQALRRANQNKNNFISMLSHELRNPLAVIAAGISLLQVSKDRLQLEKVKEMMKRQSDLLSKLVDDLLDLTRITQNKINLKKESVDLRDLVLHTARDMAGAFETKGVHFSVNTLDRPLTAAADPGRIVQSIGNLLHNALKFTSAGGSVSLVLQQEAGEAVLRVKDSGAGIKPELLPFLFDPFTQGELPLDRYKNSGLGLGLSITKGIVEMHGGTVTAESSGLNKGALFTLRMPVTADPGETAAQSPAGSSARVFRILVIEDNEELAELFCSLLNMLGHEACSAGDGQEGLDRARESRPDIIFCDIGLPGMNGYAVARQIRADAVLAKTPLIAMTGYADQNSMELARESGFDQHIAKPVSLETLQQLLQEY